MRLAPKGEAQELDEGVQETGDTDVIVLPLSSETQMCNINFVLNTLR